MGHHDTYPTGVTFQCGSTVKMWLLGSELIEIIALISSNEIKTINWMIIYTKYIYIYETENINKELEKDKMLLNVIKSKFMIFYYPQ